MGFFVTLFLAAVFFVLSEVLKPKPNIENARPAGIDEFNFPTATESRYVPVVWGTVKISGPNVVWYGDLRARAITEEVKTGMFSSETITKGYAYDVGIQFALCHGPIDSLRKVWIGEDEVFSGTQGAGTLNISDTDLFGGDDLGNGGVDGDLEVYVGTNVQTADAYLSPFQQQGGDTPAYRGICYFVWKRGYLGNSPSIKPWEFEIRRLPNPLGLSAGNNQLNSNNDVNCISALYEIMTNTDWGLGIPTSDINTSNFTSAASTIASENNGFSFVLNQLTEAKEIVREIERQIDGFVFTNRSTGLWEINLVRDGDTSIGTIDSSNTIEVKDFGSNTWQDVVNQIRVQYADRAKDYDGTFALAQDSASFRTVGGNKISDQRYPGVMSASLANSIAWRDLRSLSRPLKKATVTVTRAFYLANPGDLVQFTNPQLGVTALDMRIVKVDLGEIVQNRITLSLVEDVFSTHAASFSDPQPTNWTAPSHTMTDIAAADRSVFEAPRAFMERDPQALGLDQRVWAGARNTTGRAQRMDMLVNSVVEGTVTKFLFAAELKTAVTRNSTGTIVCKGTIDGISSIASETNPATLEDRGRFLANMVLINDELISIADAQVAGSDLNLTSPTRGVCDTVPAEHAVDDVVYFLYVGGGLSDASFSGSSVNMKLIPYSILDRLADGSATQFSVSLDNRFLKPYPPVKPSFAAVLYPTTAVSVDGTATGGADDGVGFNLTFVRRDFRTLNELDAQDSSESFLPSDFPTEHNTRYKVTITDDPDGTPTVLYNTGFLSGGANLIPISRTEILFHNSGLLPSRIRVEIDTIHTVDGTDYEADQALSWDVDLSSAELDGGDHAFGVLDDSVISNTWSAPSTATYTFSIGSNVLSSGILEVRLNGGSFTTVISSGTTSGSLAITSGDNVEIRHTQTGSNTAFTILKVNDPSSGDAVDAYGVLRI